MARRYGAERSPQVLAFLRDIVALEEKHGLSLSHEDCHGGFLVETRKPEYKAEDDDWLLAAGDDTCEIDPN